MSEMVYWVELQNGLTGVGLNAVVDLPKPEYGDGWLGKIDNKLFYMTITPKSDEDGFRDFMIISLSGQDEEAVIPRLTKFMGYAPLCKYKYRDNPKVSATYEWNKKDPGRRFKELEVDDNVYELIKLEEGFKPPQSQDMSMFYEEFTPEIVKRWEEAVRNNQEAEWNCNKIKDILPFIKKVTPRIGNNQSLFGLSIISLEGKFKNEEQIVRYGLEPLLKADIITAEEVQKIVDWYLQTQPSWHSGGPGYFKKEFEVGGQKYRLITDSYRNCRDLNLQVITE